MPHSLFRIWHPQLFHDYMESRATVRIQGNVLEYKLSYPKELPSPQKRGEITDFSRGARLRMLKHFQRINFADYPSPLFITLTYPDECANPPHAQRNIHRKVMARSLERLTGTKVPAAWRVEWMPRQCGTLIGVPCPHWHWMVFRHRFIDCHDVNQLWKKTIGHSGYCRTETVRVDKSTCIQMYMAKYLSKDAIPLSLVNAAYQNKLGRAYGWLRKKDIPLHPMDARYAISDDARAAMMALASERLPWVLPEHEQSFTLFGDVADDARRILDGELISEAFGPSGIEDLDEGQ